jgi:hypothetical protein
VWARPATICYATQSYPARPIDLMAQANGASNRVASYEPPRVGYCDRAVDEEIAAAVLPIRLPSSSDGPRRLGNRSLRHL